MAAKRLVAGGARAGEIVVVRLTYGELLLESLQEICRERKIRDGVILTGFGSLTDVAVSGAVGASFPPRKFYQRTQPRGVEVLAMAGVIAKGTSSAGASAAGAVLASMAAVGQTAATASALRAVVRR